VFAVLALELTVVVRVPRRSVQRQHLIVSQHVSEFGRALARDPVEPEHERRAVALEVVDERCDHMAGVVHRHGRNRRPVRNRGVGRHEPVRLPLVAGHVHRIEAAHDSRCRDRHHGAARLALELHLAQLPHLDGRRGTTRKPAPLAETLRAHQPVSCTHDLADALTRGLVVAAS
jgi:hypothetical protein